MKTIEERFWSKVDKSGGCWEWTAFTDAKGYGHFAIKPGDSRRAHRFSYQLINGPIPEGMFVDHICRSRNCVRPDHLRIVTPGENTEHQNGHSDSRSGRRGVSWHAASGKWHVKVTKNGKTHSGGMFHDVDEAAEVARQLRLKLHTHNELDRIPA